MEDVFARQVERIREFDNKPFRFRLGPFLLRLVVNSPDYILVAMGNGWLPTHTALNP